MKYNTSNNQNQILPNLLKLETEDEISLSEFEGFLKTEILLTEKLSGRTKFDVKYIMKIHQMALGHLYSFAGKYRDVNMTKGGFPFAAAKFLPQTMEAFDREILRTLPNKYANKEDLIYDIARVHAELLYIHPFREGNGRTARILANLMCRKQGYRSLKFEKVGQDEFDIYVSAVQQAMDKKYDLMAEFIRSIFQE